MITKIISGGQTGADRAALDWAIVNGVPHGGWCPKGRKAEDGQIPAKYTLQETASVDYTVRTERNVFTSDGTVIFSLSAKLSRGSALTARLAVKHCKPWVHIHAGKSEAVAGLRQLIEFYGIGVLNVAGSRASGEPGIAKFVTAVLTDAFTPQTSGGEV